MEGLCGTFIKANTCQTEVLADVASQYIPGRLMQVDGYQGLIFMKTGMEREATPLHIPRICYQDLVLTVWVLAKAKG